KLILRTFQNERSQSVVFEFIFSFQSQISDLAELTEAENLRNRSDRLMRYGGLLGLVIFLF
ncbi:hypothetical protein, partial [Carboxylicivirga taeanensis]|uniref:hypothetical protein n=1 Tax=Carboxylicivirga taeanensis TaxID=1416875 RepID=UPI003F6DE4EE